MRGGGDFTPMVNGSTYKICLLLFSCGTSARPWARPTRPCWRPKWRRWRGLPHLRPSRPALRPRWPKSPGCGAWYKARGHPLHSSDVFILGMEERGSVFLFYPKYLFFLSKRFQFFRSHGSGHGSGHVTAKRAAGT